MAGEMSREVSGDTLLSLPRWRNSLKNGRLPPGFSRSQSPAGLYPELANALFKNCAERCCQSAAPSWSVWAFHHFHALHRTGLTTNSGFLPLVADRHLLAFTCSSLQRTTWRNLLLNDIFLPDGGVPPRANSGKAYWLSYGRALVQITMPRITRHCTPLPTDQ